MKNSKLVNVPAGIEGKFIVSFVLLSGKRPVLDCVRHIDSNAPILYNSIDEAKRDRNYDDSWDMVIPAEEYYQRIAS